MSVLITAPIRTGKTLFSIQKIFEELNKGRIVYTNIIGIKIPGVITLTSTATHPIDWRDLPNGSVLVIDEAHEHPAYAEADLLKTMVLPEFEELLRRVEYIANPKEKKEKKEHLQFAYKKALDKRKDEIKEIGRSMRQHGHYGVEIYLITHRASDLNKDTLCSVVNHYVLRRKFGMDAAIIWEFGEAMTTWSKSTAEIALNKTLWRYPKHLYKFYVSSENHQVKKTFPLKYAAFALIPLFFFGYGALKAKETGFFGAVSSSQNPQEIQKTQVTNSPVVQHSENAQAQQDTYEEREAARRQNYQAEIANIEYNINTPYDVDYSSLYSQKDIKQLPQISGCALNNNTCTCFTQQLTKIDMSQADCKRYMSGDKPFNPFYQDVGTPPLVQIGTQS